MTPNFSQLLKKPAGEAVKPALMPAGDYPGKLSKFEVGDNNKNKTPYVRYFIAFTDWPADAPESWVEVDDSGKEITHTKASIDLSKRQMRRDYFLTEDSLYRLDEMLRSIGIEPQGRSYEECIQEAVGADVLVSVKQELNQQSNKLFNSIDKVVGA